MSLCLTSSSWTTCWTRDKRSWTLWSSSPLMTLCWSAGSVAGREPVWERINYSRPEKGFNLCYFPVVYDFPGAFGFFGWEAPHSVCALNPPGQVDWFRGVWDSEIMLERSRAWKPAINRDGGLKRPEAGRSQVESLKKSTCPSLMKCAEYRSCSVPDCTWMQLFMRLKGNACVEQQT